MEAQPCEGLEVGCSMRSRLRVEAGAAGEPGESLVSTPPAVTQPWQLCLLSFHLTSSSETEETLSARPGGSPPPHPAFVSRPVSAKTGQVDSTPGVVTRFLTTQGHHRDMAPKLKKKIPDCKLSE